MGCRGYKESGEDAENFKMMSFINHCYGDKIQGVFHGTCNTHGRHEQWALTTCKTAYSWYGRMKCRYFWL